MANPVEMHGFDSRPCNAWSTLNPHISSDKYDFGVSASVVDLSASDYGGKGVLAPYARKSAFYRETKRRGCNEVKQCIRYICSVKIVYA